MSFRVGADIIRLQVRYEISRQQKFTCRSQKATAKG